MTSFFENRVRARGGWLVVALAMAWTQSGCTPPPTEDPAVFSRMNVRGDCSDYTGQQIIDSSTFTMDTYIIQTYDVAPTFAMARSTAATSADCETCIGNNLCTIEHPRVCTCSGSVAATPDNLTAELSKTRIPGLDTNDVYCFRVLAVDNGTVGTGAPTSCQCNPSRWEDPTFLGAPMMRARLCAVSSPAAVSNLTIRLDLKCPGDRQGGGGGGQNITSPFNDCVFPPMM
jgi:hypothetical protein